MKRSRVNIEGEHAKATTVPTLYGVEVVPKHAWEVRCGVVTKSEVKRSCQSPSRPVQVRVTRKSCFVVCATVVSTKWLTDQHSMRCWTMSRGIWNNREFVFKCEYVYGDEDPR
jgi:hypothetical protein